MIDKIETNLKNNENTSNINNVNMNNMRLPRGLLTSPSSTMKVNLICQTPVTAAMEMYNYVQ